jgi:septum formation protein
VRTNLIYLASASPQRCSLLEQIGVSFEVRPADILEARHTDEDPGAYVRRLACEKADRVWDEIAGSDARPVLAADTAVVVDGQVLGKPRDARDALQMLADLSGKTHRVLTAVAVRDGSWRRSEVSRSEVKFRETTEDERRAYVATGEPMGKAGSYAIQGMGAVFIDRINGSYSGVMGLPLNLTAALLAELELPGWLHGIETGP